MSESQSEPDGGSHGKEEPIVPVVTRVSDGLCELYRAFFHKIHSIDENSNKSPTCSDTRCRDTIQEAARLGCVMCTFSSIIWKYLLNRAPFVARAVRYDLNLVSDRLFGVLVRLHEGAGFSRLYAPLPSSEIWFELQSESSSKFSIVYSHLCFHLVTKHLHAMLDPEEQDIDRPPSRNTEDPGCFELMNTWLQRCSTDHKQCLEPSDAWLPTRLVDVSNPIRPRLVLAAAIQDCSASRYATLSHRWGENMVCLTKQNFEEFQHCLPTRSLSQTFLDAFLAARELGLRYIWIDSLCILQDSELD